MTIILTLYLYPANQTREASFATRFISYHNSTFKIYRISQTVGSWDETLHSESLAKSQGEGSSTNIVIHGELRPYHAKLDAKAVGGPAAGALEELCWVPFHILGAPKVSAMLSKCVNLCLFVHHTDRKA